MTCPRKETITNTILGVPYSSITMMYPQNPIGVSKNRGP